MTIASSIAISVVRLYQLCISPWLGQRCRFEPTCSHYAIESFQHHNAPKAAWLTLRRIARCHPLGGMGYDPVPPAQQK